MSEIGNLIKKLTLEELSKQNPVALNRIGHVGIVNSDGTAMVLIDGQGFTAELVYPAVKGQEVLMMPDSSGGFKAMPTRPNPTPVAFDQPHFFAGGFLKFASGTEVQQAFDPNAYRLVAHDLPGYISKGSTFSPDGTRFGIVFVKTGTTDVHFRVYNIGDSVTAGPIIGPGLFELKATLLFEIVRTMNWQGGAHSTRGMTWNAGGPSTAAWVLALDKDSTQMYWVEYETDIPSVSINGAPIQTAHFYKLNGTTPVQIGQWTVLFTNRSSTAGFSQRIIYYIGGLETGDPNGPLHTGVFDAATAEMLALHSVPFGHGFIAPHGLGIVSYPTAFAIVTPSGQDYTADTAIVVLPSDTFPSTVVPNGATILLDSIGASASLLGPVTRQQSFYAMPYKNVGEDFLRLVYENVFTKVKSQATITNPISTDLIANGQVLLSSKTNGLLIDFDGHVRPLKSTDDGVTFTAESDPTKFLQISPGQIDPSVIVNYPSFRTNLVAVSTL